MPFLKKNGLAPMLLITSYLVTVTADSPRISSKCVTGINEQLLKTINALEKIGEKP